MSADKDKDKEKDVTFNDRIEKLEFVEQQIASALQLAGQGLLDLAKDKPTNRQIESNATQFVKTLESIESELSGHIDYLTTVSTGQPHERSSYAAHKDLQMAHHRLEHVKSRLAELEQMHLERLQPQQRTGVDAGLSISNSNLTFGDV